MCYRILLNLYRKHIIPGTRSSSRMDSEEGSSTNMESTSPNGRHGSPKHSFIVTVDVSSRRGQATKTQNVLDLAARHMAR